MFGGYVARNGEFALLFCVVKLSERGCCVFDRSLTET